jgi:hypothetical protein
MHSAKRLPSSSSRREKKMGEKDSSRTRVAPVFNILYARDKTGKTWLPRLLRLPTGGHPIRISSEWDFTIQDAGWGENEKKLDPPISLLSWLIRHPKIPANGQLSHNSVKAQKRHDLIEGSDARLVEALGLLSYNPEGHDWHIFEGRTQPDVFIQTPYILIVIEGKRTEREATKETKWMAGRHQMLRHIDCAWEIKGKRKVVGFFIVEGDGAEGGVPPFWLDQARKTISREAIMSSLPHRGPEEQEGISRCFLGVTTWQRVCREFGIDWTSITNLTTDTGRSL